MRLLCLAALLCTATPSNASETQCLAEVLHHEARGEPVRGQLAVAQVVLNRTQHVQYPHTICQVVYQPHQFSWTHKHRAHQLPQHTVALATTILLRGYALRNFTATHFHYRGVQPHWNLPRTTRIHNHVFYTQP